MRDWGMAWFAVLLVGGCTATPELDYLSDDGGSIGQDQAEAGSEAGLEAGTSVDAAVERDSAPPSDGFAMEQPDANVPGCVPSPMDNQKCCSGTAVKCVGAGCDYCNDCAMCNGYCCRRTHPTNRGTCKPTASCM